MMEEGDVHRGVSDGGGECPSISTSCKVSDLNISKILHIRVGKCTPLFLGAVSLLRSSVFASTTFIAQNSNGHEKCLHGFISCRVSHPEEVVVATQTNKAIL